MKIPYRWIREFVELDLPPAQAADRLVNAGIEVAAVTPLAPTALAGVVIGEIEAVERDVGETHGYRLLLCRVSTGRERFAVVCGAPNITVGARAAFAPPGAVLPAGPGRSDGRKIGVARLRGVESQGMLCSERELGLGEEHERGILLVEPGAPLGADLVAHLGLDDVVLEIEVTPNRPDCLSVLGVARELAALTGGRLRPPPAAVREGREPARSLARVRIEDPDLCARYAARVIGGVRVAPSPAWLAARLRAVGLRPISNVVDVTNYVLWELGHPLHAFDHRTVSDATIVVRRARRGERLKTLDGQERELRDSMLVIADPRRAIAIAGVMGGADTEVGDGTTRVLLESAYFQPASVRRTARALGLATDAAYRFERGADVEGLRLALDRAAALIAEVAGGTVARGVVDAYPRRRRTPRVRLRMSRVKRVLGIAPTRSEARRILTGLGLATADRGGDLVVAVPSFRRDLAMEDDLVEEIIRVWGYDRIPSTLPGGAIALVRQPESLRQEDALRQALVGAGLAEVITYGFGDPARDLGRAPGEEPLTLRNPLSHEGSRLRGHPLEGVLAVVETNRRRQQEDVRVFEIGKTYARVAGAVRERRWAAVALAGARAERAWSAAAEAVDVYDAKGLAEHALEALGVAAAVHLEGRMLPGADRAFEPDCHGGFVARHEIVARYGEVAAEARAAFGIDGPVFAAVIALDTALALAPAVARYEPLPRFPAVQRDLAFIVPGAASPAPTVDGSAEEVPGSVVPGAASPARTMGGPPEGVFGSVPLTAAQLEAVIREAAGPLVKRLTLFDQFLLPEGGRSLAWRLTFQAEDRTLTDDEVNRICERIAADVRARFGVSLRTG